jgi:hypothetical protein
MSDWISASVKECVAQPTIPTEGRRVVFARIVDRAEAGDTGGVSFRSKVTNRPSPVSITNTLRSRVFDEIPLKPDSAAASSLRSIR